MNKSISEVIAEINNTKGHRQHCNSLHQTLSSDGYVRSIVNWTRVTKPERIDALLGYVSELEFLRDTACKVMQEFADDSDKFDTAKLINKFYERYPLNTFNNDGDRAQALGYFMAGAELQNTLVILSFMRAQTMMPDKELTDDALNAIIANAKTSMEQYLALAIKSERKASQRYTVPDAIEPTYEAIKSVLPTANPDEYACCVGADMWNACRATMLQHQPQNAQQNIPCPKCGGHGTYHCHQMLGTVECECTLNSPVIPDGYCVCLRN